jgi:hypothetical protein
MAAWKPVPCEDYEKAKKDFVKKWRPEMLAVANNLQTLMQTLDRGVKPEQLKSLPFVHGEYPIGILSIDESGHEKKSKPKAIRLYVFPCESKQLLYVMLIGDKSEQHDDVKLCKAFVSKIFDSCKPPPQPARQSTKSAQQNTATVDE